MRHLLYSAQMSDGRQVCIAPVSLDLFEANAAFTLGDDTGYFIYEYDDEQSGGIEILGKAASYDAAVRIAEMLGGCGCTNCGPEMRA